MQFTDKSAQEPFTIKHSQSSKYNMQKRTNPSHQVLNSELPLHHQIYLHLRSEIENGDWIGRLGFPGEKDLAEQFGVSVITSRKALNRLASDGFIERTRGKRAIVIHRPHLRSNTIALPIIQVSVGAPRLFKYQILSCGVHQAPTEACEAFNVDAGSELWQCSRLRLYQGKPHSVTLNAQRTELGQTLPMEKLQKLPMTQILRETGVEFSQLRRRLSVALAPPHAAQHLGLTLQDPTLVYSFIHTDPNDVVVQWVRIWVRQDALTPEEIFNYETGTWSMSAAM